MIRWRKRIKRMTYILTDLFCIILASIMTYRTYTSIFTKPLTITPLEHIGYLSIVFLLFLGSFFVLGIYDRTIEHNGLIVGTTSISLIIAYGVITLFLELGLYVLDNQLPLLYIGGFMLLVIGLQFINRLTLHYLLYKRSSKSEAVRNILIVGQSSKGLAYMKEIAKYHYLNLNIVGYISIKEPIPYNGIPHLGSVDDLADVATKHVIDEIAVARPLYYDPRLSDVLAQCQIMGITVTMLLDTHNTNEMKVQVAMVGKIPVLKFHSVSLNESQLFVKRLLDIVGSLVGMLMFLLFYVTLGPLIKMETPGPIIFKQDRVGKNGRVFKVWKFRSMGQDAELQKAELQTDNEMTGHMFKMHNDPRVTKIGALMRRTSIDEFPQFYNVLRGDMSLVGTRPPTVEEVASYEQYQLKRISITPGITGNWQVSGRSNIADFEEVLRLDNAYIENWSLWSDLKIIIKTLKVVLSRRGSI